MDLQPAPPDRPTHDAVGRLGSLFASVLILSCPVDVLLKYAGRLERMSECIQLMGLHVFWVR